MKLRSIATQVALLALLWWVLSGGRADAWPFGAVAIGAALAVQWRLRGAPGASIAPTALLPYLWFFLTASVRGGLQVALRAVRPHPGLHPAVIDLPLRLTDPAERLFLASTMSLMPGTLSVGLDKAVLQVHVLDRELAPLDELRRAERHVARLFGSELP